MGYEFKDVGSGIIAPAQKSAESLALDGVYLEDVIPGFRVLYTKGREVLNYSLETATLPRRDGELTLGGRWPARTVAVGYQLIAPSAAAFRAAMLALGSYLHGRHRLVFADEDDKFLTGTYTGMDNHEPGTNSIVGEITFFCADPFRYSVEEYSAPTRYRDGQDGHPPKVLCPDGVYRALRTFQVTYNGILPAHPRFHTEFYDPENDTDDGDDAKPSWAGDCGYIAFLDMSGHVLQFGDPDEADGERHPDAQKIIDKSFTGKGSWSANARSTWKRNGAGSGSNIGYTDPEITAEGDVQSAYSKAVTAEEIAAETAGALDGLRYLAPSSFGSSTRRWHGPAISARVAKDEAGVRGASDWKLYFRIKFGASDSIQIGIFRAVVTASGGAAIASVEIAKATNSMTGTVTVRFGDKTKTQRTDLSYYNKCFGANGKKTCTVTKTGQTAEFDIGGIRFTLKDADIETAAAWRVSLIWAVYDDEEPVSRCGVYNVRLTKIGCSTWTDVRNKFGGGDTLDVDTADASVALNGEPTPDLGALGNDWEGLALVPGEQHIIESRSSWCASEYRPVTTMYWREVFP